MGDREWAGSENLAVTYGYQYRAMVAALKPEPEGALSTLVYQLNENDREALRGLIVHTGSQVADLDPKISLRTAAQAARDIGRLNQIQAELIGAAIFYDASIAVGTIPPNVQSACHEYGIPFTVVS